MNIIIIIVVALLVTLIILMLNKKIRTIAMRNLFRRKGQTLLIILGSMVGTAMITGSLGINDSMKYMLYAQTKNNIGEIDLILTKGNSIPDSKHEFQEIKPLSEFDISSIADFTDTVKNSVYSDHTNEIYIMDINIYSGTNTIVNLINNASVKLIAFDFDKPGVFSEFIQDDSQVILDKDIFVNSKLENLSISKSTGNPLELLNKKINLENFSISDKKLLTLNIFRQETRTNQIVFMDINYFYSLFPEKNKKLNALVISNTGDWLNGRFLSPQILSYYEKSELSSKGFELYEIKNEEIDAAGMANIGYFFLVLSFFSILAGLFLIINTFNMLAKERAKELGMLRAIGFLKNDIKKLFFLEGIFYTIFSSALGVLSGMLVSKYILGNITQYVFSLSNKFLDAIGNTFINMGDIPKFEFYISWDSILISYLSGVIISLLTVYLFSKKIANFNIVNAIKGIEEEKSAKTKARNIICIIFMLSGLLLTGYGTLVNLITFSYLGLSFVLIPLSIFCFYFTKKQNIKFLLSNISYNIPLILLMIVSFTMNVDLEKYPLQYILLILEKSGVIILTLSLFFINNLVLLRKSLTDTRLSNLFKPYVLKIGIAYPENERRKTALMIAMYSLVIYIIVLVSVIPYTQQKGIERSKETIFWSYNAFIPDVFNSSSDDLKNELSKQHFVEKVNELYTSFVSEDFKPNQQVFTSDERLHINSEIGKWYGNADIKSLNDALISMEKNKNQFIIMKSKSFDDNDSSISPDLSLLDDDSEYLGTFVFDNITFFQGIVFNNPELLTDSNRIKYLFVKIKGNTKEELNKNSILFNEYMESKNLLAITDEDVIEISNVAISGMIQVLNGFLYFGMIVGIIGISITMYRAFLERKKVIGMLKAIGFNGGEIFKTFLFETSIIVIIGLFIGILSGIITSSLVNSLFADIGAPGGSILSIPWVDLGQTVIIFYVFSIISTLIPSYQASILSPAEALKYYE